MKMDEAPSAKESASTGPKTITVILIIFGVALGLLLIFPGSIALECFKTIYRADEGFKKAERTIDAEQLRAWALQEIKDRSGTNNPEIPSSEIPVNLRNLYSRGPKGAQVTASSTVAVFWGGGFFGWGFNIGDTNYSEPSQNQNSEYRYFEWTNGIYYSRESSWGLW